MNVEVLMNLFDNLAIAFASACVLAIFVVMGWFMRKSENK